MQGVNSTVLRSIAACVIMTIAAIYMYAPVRAEEPKRGLALSPLRSEYEIAPGESKKTSIRVKNFTNKPLDVRLAAEEFGVTNQQYDYAFSPGTDVSGWVSFDNNELRLDPEKSVYVTVTISVPVDAEPGGRYISVFAVSDVRTSSSGFQAQQRVASLFYITVKGEVTQAGTLKSLESPFVYDGRKNWKMIVANSGTTHFHSRYTASIHSIFDGNEVARYSNTSLILPGADRELLARIPSPAHVGIYKVKYIVGLGDSPAAKREHLIVFLPQQAYLPLFTLAVLLTAGFVYMVRNLTRRKRRKSRK